MIFRKFPTVKLTGSSPTVKLTGSLTSGTLSGLPVLNFGNHSFGMLFRRNSKTLSKEP